MCLQTTAEEEDKWGTVVRTDHQFFQEFVDDNENTKSLAEATVNNMPGQEPTFLCDARRTMSPRPRWE